MIGSMETLLRLSSISISEIKKMSQKMLKASPFIVVYHNAACIVELMLIMQKIIVLHHPNLA